MYFLKRYYQAKQLHEDIKLNLSIQQSSMTVLFPCLTSLTKRPIHQTCISTRPFYVNRAKAILLLFVLVLGDHSSKAQTPPIYAISPILLSPLSEPRLRARPWLLLRILMNPVTGPFAPSCSTLKLARASSPDVNVSKYSDRKSE